MRTVDDEIDELLRRAEHGDGSAVDELLARHRERLRRMIDVRMQPQLAARLDASDVLQDTFVEAIRCLPDYLHRRPLPFYLWIRQLAWQRLMRLYRDHVLRQKRSVSCEDPVAMPLSDESGVMLADQFATSGTSPSAHVLRLEMIDRVQSALGHLKSSDREILILRHMEQLSVDETAEVLGVSPTVITTRHFRAMQRLHRMLVSNREAIDG